MKDRKITKAIVSYLPLNEINNTHWIIDENGNEKPIRNWPYWLPTPNQSDKEAVFIDIVTSDAADTEKQALTLESILSRFEGITPVDGSQYIKKQGKTSKSPKKSPQIGI